MKEKVNEIMNIMDTIEYGFKDENNQNIINTNQQKWDDEFENFYYLQKPEELLNTKCGVCWDQVELERKLFEEKKITCKSFFMYILSNKNLPSHTFITFKMNDKVYWFEHSWGKYKGIHEYINEEELLKDIINKFREDHLEVNTNDKLYLYEYKKPKYHISCDEFYKYIETQKIINTNFK